MDSGYKRVMVVGATMCGKTSLLASLSHSQSTLYDPTVIASKFTDCGRKIVFIDTPGIDDSVLHMGGDDPSARYSAFSDDSLCKELRGVGNAAAANGAAGAPEFNVFKDKAIVDIVQSNLVSVDAVIIMYTDSTFCKRTAKALRYMYYVLTHSARASSSSSSGASGDASKRDLRIFMVRNLGELHRPILSELLNDRPDLSKNQSSDESKKEMTNDIFGDGPMFPAAPSRLIKPLIESSKELPPVNAVSEAGIDALFLALQQELGMLSNMPIELSEPPVVEAQEQREQCGGGGCVIA